MSELISLMLEENPRRAIRRALANGELLGAIVPVGSTEQHNEHLAMGHDTRSVLHVARGAAEQLKPAVIVTPPLSVGVSEHWMDHKGTLTLRPETFCQVVYEVCASLRRHGFRYILILNGHGGNTGPLRKRLPDFKRELRMVLDFCCYWEGYPKALVIDQMESGECPAHASEFETSFALAAFPHTVHFSDEPYPSQELIIVDDSKREADRRYYHQARLATAKKGQVMIDFAIGWVVDRIRQALASDSLK